LKRFPTKAPMRNIRSSISTDISNWSGEMKMLILFEGS
jgi:hypothetical protein